MVPSRTEPFTRLVFLQTSKSRRIFAASISETTSELTLQNVSGGNENQNNMKNQVSKFAVGAQAQVNNLSEALLMEDIAYKEQEDAFIEAMLDADIAYHEQEEAVSEAMLFIE